MDTKGNTRSDLKVPEETDDDKETANKIKNGLEEGKEVLVTVLAAMQIEKIVECKEI